MIYASGPVQTPATHVVSGKTAKGMSLLDQERDVVFEEN
jgi:hypothetical protein